MQHSVINQYKTSQAHRLDHRRGPRRQYSLGDQRQRHPHQQKIDDPGQQPLARIGDLGSRAGRHAGYPE
jgi:hypothetical protein